MEQLNIEEIMEEIRAKIKAQNYDPNILSFEDIPICNTNLEVSKFNKESLISELDSINNHWNVEAYRNVGGGLKGFIKKVIRKFVKFYVEPIVCDQNQYNASITKTINLFNCYIEEKELECEEMRYEIKKLSKEIEKIKIQNNNFQS